MKRKSKNIRLQKRASSFWWLPNQKSSPSQLNQSQSRHLPRKWSVCVFWLYFTRKIVQPQRQPQNHPPHPKLLLLLPRQQRPLVQLPVNQLPLRPLQRTPMLPTWWQWVSQRAKSNRHWALLSTILNAQLNIWWTEFRRNCLLKWWDILIIPCFLFNRA